MRYSEHKIPYIKIFHSSVSAGKRNFNSHHHTECELSLIANGSGLYTVKDTAYSFSKGDIFLFGSDEIHCITSINGPEHLDIINIHFEPKIIYASNLKSLDLLKLFNDRNENFSNKIKRNNPTTKIIKQKFNIIENEFINMSCGYELKINMEILDILLLILRDYNYVNATSENPNDNNFFQQISFAVDYINEHLSENLTLDSIADAAMLSKTYFSAMFKRCNGISPWNYITIKRVEKAITLLKTKNSNKLDIAYECGFSGHSNFYKAFKKVTGKTPNDYASKTK